MPNRIEANCNKFLAYLLTVPRNQMTCDKDIQNGAELSEDDFDDCLTKLFDSGYVNGGKDATFLTTRGREFAEDGGYKDANGNSVTINSIGVNYGVANQGRDFRDNETQNNVTTQPNMNESATVTKSWYEIPFVKNILLPGLIAIAAVLLGWWLTKK